VNQRANSYVLYDWQKQWISWEILISPFPKLRMKPASASLGISRKCFQRNITCRQVSIDHNCH